MVRPTTIAAVYFCLIASVLAAEITGNQVTQPSRLLRYHPDGADIVIANGKNRFNRSLYGSNTAFFVYAGDLPEILLCLPGPGKGGTLWLGIAAADKSKWLSDADRITTRYRAGAMQYEIRDSLLGDGSLTLDVESMANAEGAMLRLAVSENASPVELICAFGGASGFVQNLDTCRYCPESVVSLKPADCVKNEFKLTETGFELRAACHGSRPLAGTMPPGTVLKIANADELKSPQALWVSSGDERPILAGRRALTAGQTLLVALEWLLATKTALQPADLGAAFDAAEAHRASTARRVQISTPDPFMNAAAPAISSAADGLWNPPTYLHGGVAWHFPYLGWRGAYIGSEFGWHDRARLHFRTYAELQFKEPATAEPHAGEEFNLSRQGLDSVLYSRGYIPANPVKGYKGPYDMQQVYIDQLLWHFLWTGDMAFAREMWPVLMDHLAWEKRCFDPDDDGLYENYGNTLVSDAHHYSGGACAQASAYNHRALQLAARLAIRLGEDPKPFQRAAEKTLAAMNRVLWMPELGWYAECKDLLGLKQLHPSAELPSVYHPIDSDVPDRFQAYQMLRYMDTAFERVPVEGNAVLLWNSNWVPYIWSIRNVWPCEVAHTALACWQSGRRDAAWRLWRGAILDAMYSGRAPGNCLATSESDGHLGGLCTDFNCPVGMFGRALVEGLFGVVPNLIDGELLIRPGLPADWDSASIDTPDVGYTYSRKGDTERFEVRSKLSGPVRLRLRVAARAVQVAQVTINGQQADWICIPSVGEPVIEILAVQADGANVEIRWQGDEPARIKCPDVVGLGESFVAEFGLARVREVHDPQQTLQGSSLDAGTLRATAIGQVGHRTAFAKLEQGDLYWWAPVPFEIRPPLEICQSKVDWERGEVELAVRNNTDTPIAGPAIAMCGGASETINLQALPRSQSSPIRLPAKNLVPGANPIALDLGQGRTLRSAVVDWHPPAGEQKPAFECVDVSAVFNDRVTEIFKHEYRSPRSPRCSLQIPLHGFGDWNYLGKYTPTIDDSALRTAAGAAGRLVSPQGIPLATPGPGNTPNIVFTSQWDNFPKEVTVPLSGRARHAWFLVAGSTHPMQSQFDNGEILITYADGQPERLALHNPTTWWPIEADYDLKLDGFCVPGPHPPRIDLGAGRATLLDLPVNPDRELRSLNVRCLANDVVVGLMSATLLRPQ